MFVCKNLQTNFYDGFGRSGLKTWNKENVLSFYSGDVMYLEYYYSFLSISIIPAIAAAAAAAVVIICHYQLHHLYIH